MLNALVPCAVTVQEKLAIARERLAARQIARNGLDPAEVQVTDDAFLAIIEGYTREAGVRGLERQIGQATAQGGHPSR